MTSVITLAMRGLDIPVEHGEVEEALERAGVLREEVVGVKLADLKEGRVAKSAGQPLLQTGWSMVGWAKCLANRRRSATNASSSAIRPKNARHRWRWHASVTGKEGHVAKDCGEPMQCTPAELKVIGPAPFGASSGERGWNLPGPSEWKQG